MNSAPAQNRVSPLGEIVAAPGRGAWMGNRGRLHEGAGTRRIVRPYRLRAWITCRLEFRGWRAEQWQPNHYTPLFFLDEAVAFAAGHRPCAECRWTSYLAFREAAARALGAPQLRVDLLDRTLHAQRWDAGTRRQRTHTEPWPSLPDGTFVLVGDAPMLVRADRLVRWEPDNSYGAATARPAGGAATVITPELTVAILRAGYPAQIGAAW